MKCFMRQPDEQNRALIKTAMKELANITFSTNNTCKSMTVMKPSFHILSFVPFYSDTNNVYRKMNFGLELTILLCRDTTRANFSLTV